jgi:hypothetical protein
MRMIYEKINVKTLAYTVFSISDAVVFCELFRDDKILGLHTKKLIIIYFIKKKFIIIYFINIKIFKSICLYFINIKIFKSHIFIL